MITSSPSGLPHYSEARTLSLLLLAVLWLFSAHCTAQDMNVSPTFSEEVEQRVTTLTNEFRAQNGLPALEREGRLTEAARAFAAYLASTGKLDHDADGTTPPDRVKKRGYNFCAVAENLASEYSSAGFAPNQLSANFVQGWRGSPTHRENMLLPDMTQVGVGIARSTKDGEYFAVQVFARPMAEMLRFRVTNRSNATVRYEFRKRIVTLGPRQWRAHESCAAGDVRLDTGGQDVTLRPKNGAKYAVVEAGRGAFAWREE